MIGRWWNRGVVAMSGLLIGSSSAAFAAGAWIDALPGAWNTPGAAVPAAPAGDAEQLTRCAEQIRPASTAADRALEAAGWKLFGPVLSHGTTSIVRATSNADGMCRPLGYQFFLFVGDAFAGTLAPAPMDSRTDGALSDLFDLEPTSAIASFSRYAEADALCCPSRESVVTYAVEQRDGRPVLTALSARTVTIPPQAETPPTPPLWTGSVGAGISLTTGNTDTSSYNLAFSAVRDAMKKWVFRTEGLYLRSEENDIDTADKTVFLARAERSFTDRFFGFGEVGYLDDRFKEIDYLITPTVGIGYKVILPEPVSFVVDGGIAGAFEKELDGESTEDLAFKLGDSLDWAISERVTFFQTATGLWKFEDTDDAHYRGDIGIAASLTKSSELRITYLLDYDNLPPSPELDKLDTALLVTYVMKF
jgi:putative salt-induced outer membrane protein YdiY